MEHWAKKIFKKLNPKHVQNTFGRFWERFWAFLKILKFFRFFENISKTRPSMEHWAEIIFEKNTPKHVQNTFRHFWERFWAFLEFWKFFNFLKTFRRLDPPWNTGQKNFLKKIPQNMFKTRLDILGRILGIFESLKIFKFFWKHFEDSTLDGTLGKKIFKNITTKHVQNTFGHFWDDFGHFWNFWKFFDFLKTFRRLDPTWNTGEKKLFWKSTPKLVRNTFGQFRNDFGHFWNF